MQNQSEQKRVDKDEPKFKVGDWIIYRDEGCTEILRISSVTKTHYICIDISDDYCRNLNIKFIDNHNYHLWTIQDAKNGDVLFMDNGSANCIFIYKSFNNGIINKYASYNNFGFEGEHYLVLNDGYVVPATKEQREMSLL